MMMRALTEAELILLEDALNRPKRSKPSRVDSPVPLYDVQAILEDGDIYWAQLEKAAKKKIQKPCP